jgi:hypothetical protein
MLILLQLSIATPKPGLSEIASLNNEALSNSSYSGYYEHYWTDKAAWGNYAAYQVKPFNIGCKASSL